MNNLIISDAGDNKVTPPTAPDDFGPAVEIWTDGACCPNPGPGAWGCIIRLPEGAVKTIAGTADDTTNARMELTAIAEALEQAKRPRHIRFYSDSLYIVAAINRDLARWIEKGWKTAARTPVANRDLWERFIAAQARHRVEIEWVKGHAGDPMNERAHALAAKTLEAFQHGKQGVS